MTGINDLRAGDKLSFTTPDLENPGEFITKSLWLVQDDRGDLWTWHPYDREAPNVPVKSFGGLAALNVTWEREATLEESIPKEAGKYLSVDELAVEMLRRVVAPDNKAKTEFLALREDGVWVDAGGTVCEPWEIIAMCPEPVIWPYDD